MQTDGSQNAPNPGHPIDLQAVLVAVTIETIKAKVFDIVMAAAQITQLRCIERDVPNDRGERTQVVLSFDTRQAGQAFFAALLGLQSMTDQTKPGDPTPRPSMPPHSSA
jgi:hypothetical protein